ncbi:MAG: hypothetical protein M1833_004208 [Piccolia ochrophora]|nr:MAG: hypothetical protein M1833_004208 [Piccolia ochrophora]
MRAQRHEATSAGLLVKKAEKSDRRDTGPINAGQGGPNKRRSRHDDIHEWELTVGIEIHAQLNTKRKLFSSAATSINESPNSHIALFDAALPGAQPLVLEKGLQTETLIPALRAALAFNCRIEPISRFDRKHYFYQDQPAGYQITQYYEPLARDGQIVLSTHDGIAPEDECGVIVGIKQVQIEQDTAKTLLQGSSMNLLDFNRVSHPLIEIITLPQLHHPATAAACVQKIQTILKSVDACTLGMEMGGLRADVNVSVRRRSGQQPDLEYHGVKGLGQRTEIKNLSSFRAIEEAIEAERDRQISVLKHGGIVEGETRGWTLGSVETTTLRGKEGEVDYRYMPDPDIPPVVIDPNLIDYLEKTLPLQPDDQLKWLNSSPLHGLTIKDAKTLMSLDDGNRLDFYETVRAIVHTSIAEPKTAQSLTVSDSGRVTGNWVLHELGGLLSSSEKTWDQNPVSAEAMAKILILLLQKEITGKSAKRLLAMTVAGDHRSIEQLVRDENLLLKHISEDDYERLALEVIRENGDVVDSIKRQKKMGKVNFLVGLVMRRGEKGSMEAPKVESAIRRLLDI